MLQKYDKKDSIAVFDSGVGGISVLRELHRLMPRENYIYFGDSANAPYGTKTPESVLELTRKITEDLLAMKAKCIVIACNTATSAAAEALRKEYPELDIIGIEPALKPAALGSASERDGNSGLQGEQNDGPQREQNGGKQQEQNSGAQQKQNAGPQREQNGKRRVLVLATERTVHGEKLLKLAERYTEQAEIELRPAQRIVEFVEAGERDGRVSGELVTYLKALLADAGRFDAVVLGCTHFPFVRNTIQSVLPAGTAIYDGAEGVARYTCACLRKRDLLNEEGPGEIIFLNSDPESIELEKQMFTGPSCQDTEING